MARQGPRNSAFDASNTLDHSLRRALAPVGEHMTSLPLHLRAPRLSREELALRMQVCFQWLRSHESCRLVIERPCCTHYVFLGVNRSQTDGLGEKTLFNCNRAECSWSVLTHSLLDLLRYDRTGSISTWR